jgi:uncharacterized phiE125 gp8 family phage protein
MTTIRWESKRPNEVRDYLVDWTAFLAGDTIATSDVTVTGATLDSDTNDTTSATVWLSGGTAGTTARIVNTITTAGGRTETQVFTLAVVEYEEPVSIEQAKLQCRIVDDDSEDALLCGYIRGAREWVENYTGHVLVRREFVETFDSFGRYIDLIRRPITAITEVGYTDSAGLAAVYADAVYDLARRPVRLYPARDGSWPGLGIYGTVSVTYTAGYDDAAADRPLVREP